MLRPSALRLRLEVAVSLSNGVALHGPESERILQRPLRDAMAPVPLLDLRAQYASIRDEVRAAMDRVTESQRLILGPEVEEFEREIAAYCGCKHAIGCSSGTDALVMALMALGVGPGQQVITSAYTFFATAGSIARLGARPVFADIDPVSFNMDAAYLEWLVTKKARAIIPVHLYGQCTDARAVLEGGRRHGLPVIEDAAQAIGAETEGRRAGALGEIGCFSFYPSKNLGAFGDAGMVTTNSDDLADRLRALRVHGSQKRYYHAFVGGNFRLDALQAAVLRVKLRYLDRWTEARQRNAAQYNRLFSEAGAAIAADELKCHARKCKEPEKCELEKSGRIVLPAESPAQGQHALRLDAAPFPGHRHVYNQYVIRAGCRDAVIASLKKAEVGYEIYYPLPLHLQECFAALGHKRGDLPASECAARTSLALPIYPELAEEQQRRVVDAVVRGVRGE